MAIQVDILTPRNQQGGPWNPSVMVSSISSGVEFEVLGYSTVVAQIDTPLDSAAAGTITLQCSQDGLTWHPIPGGAVTYTASGVQAKVDVEGLRFIRYQVTTTSGAVEYMVTVTGVRNV